MDPLSIDEMKELKSKFQDIKDTDLSDEINNLISILKKIQSKESIENYFENKKESFDYFISKFCPYIIELILESKNLYNESIELEVINLLYHFLKLFLIFHKKDNYSKLFKILRLIITPEKNVFLFPKKPEKKNESEFKKYFTYFQYNQNNCLKFIISKKLSQEYKIKDNVDILIENKEYKELKKDIDKYSWVRGVVSRIYDNNYHVDYGSNQIKIPMNSYRILNSGAMTEDWDWRTNLKKNEVIDYFDGAQWKPSTIIDVNNVNIENGFQIKKYKIGQRLLINELKDYEKYKEFWENGQIDKDTKSFGDKYYLDKEILCYSKRIQKLNTFTQIQKKNLKYKYPQSEKDLQNNDKSVEIYKKTLNLITEDEKELIPKLFFYEGENIIGKNYIIGKSDNFSYYYALLLKRIADDNYFNDFIDILKNNPNSEEIYNIFYILYYSLDYLHPEYFQKGPKLNLNFINFIKNIDDKN